MSFVRRLDVVRIYAVAERAAHPAALHFWRYGKTDKSKVVFVGLDVAKDTLAVSVADEGRCRSTLIKEKLPLLAYFGDFCTSI